MEIRVEDLRPRATWTQAVTLECAGNGRSFLDPPAPGEQWELGAVGTAEWTGLPLSAVLAEAGVLPSTVELLFTGADEGLVGAVGREMAFQRSLPIEDAGLAFLVTAMNGAPLTPNHGAPVRLLVPGRYGMASVKWLSRITALDVPFGGFFQVDRYVVDGRPLGSIAPRAVIAQPAAGSTVPAAPRQRARVRVVRRGTDRARRGQRGWRRDVGRGCPGPLLSPTAWREWSFDWTPGSSGEATLLARATDATGSDAAARPGPDRPRLRQQRGPPGPVDSRLASAQ